MLLHAGNVESSCSEIEVGTGRDTMQPVQVHFFKQMQGGAKKPNNQQLFTRHLGKTYGKKQASDSPQSVHNPTRVNLSGGAGCIREALGSLRWARVDALYEPLPVAGPSFL